MRRLLDIAQNSQNRFSYFFWFKLKGVKKVNTRVNITTSHGMGDGKRKADNDTGNSRKKSSMVLEQPQATTERFYFCSDQLFEVDIVGLHATLVPEFEVHEGHARRIVGSAPRGLPSMAVRSNFSGNRVSLVMLEWIADEKPGQVVVPCEPEDEDAVHCMLSDHQNYTCDDARTYHCKEVASLCTVYRDEKGELSVCEAGIGAVLGTWRMVDKGLFAEVQCVSYEQSGAEVETQFKLQVSLYLARLKDSICVLQHPHFRKRLERKEGGVVHYVGRDPSKILYVMI